MPPREDYVVGWICGLVSELVAAKSFMDDIHPDDDFSVLHHDNNSYIRGRIGVHNVVVACLPYGEYGTVSAATVARDMLHTFPNIRIGLFVGIGGGAPSKAHDIRLGDVVVSADFGVHEYDIHEAIKTKQFRSSKHLNTPLSLFRAAITKVNAQYLEDGHQIQSNIEKILERKPRLKTRGFGRPSPEADTLYAANAVHPMTRNSLCEEVCDQSKLMKREERTKDDQIQIFYGNIASSNMVMKDAELRDKFSEAKEILCFETEASGLMNHYPCIIIRGICDYADSHANDKWHGYAAMSAAAFAKNLLLNVHPEVMETQKRVSESMTNASATNVNSAIQTDDAAAVQSSQNTNEENSFWTKPNSAQENAELEKLQGCQESPPSYSEILGQMNAGDHMAAPNSMPQSKPSTTAQPADNIGSRMGAT